MLRVPFEVCPYSVDVLCNFISQATDTPFHHVRQKRQITYLNHYLGHWRDMSRAKGWGISLVVENAYIDQHFIEDYSQYFVRCFRQYPRDCMRIHFFDTRACFNGPDQDLDTETFRKWMVSPAVDDEKDPLRQGYLGYMVVRPIPSTFIAKLCLKAYGHENGEEGKVLLTHPYKASLFGVNLVVGSIAFQEQDRVLSACATSALWSFFHAQTRLGDAQLPSPIEITKSAYSDNPYVDVPFPNAGLSLGMMCRGVRANGLEPKLLTIPEDDPDPDLFLEMIYAYCSGGHPLLMGVTVYRKVLRTPHPQGKGGWNLKQGLADFLIRFSRSKNRRRFRNHEPIGLHAVTILGFALAPQQQEELPDDARIRMRGHRIHKLYIHDDRTGPFACLERVDEGWELEIEGQFSQVQRIEKEIYHPTDLILGLYHKIRLHYLRMRATCTSLQIRLLQILDIDYKDDPEDLKAIRTYLGSLEWDIKIEEVSNIKERIRKDPNVLTEKEDFLTRSFPKYIWTLKTWIGSEPIFELLFDATDIPQGSAFLGVVHYDEEIEGLFGKFAEFCRNSYHEFRNENKFDSTPLDHLGGIVEYFTKQATYGDSLDGMYGRPKLPKYIKDFEIAHDLLQSQSPKIMHCECTDFQLCPENDYIWVINLEGGLVVGHELEEGRDGYGGHPTLLRGAPGRIGGELRFREDTWLINARSGRYSYTYSPLEQKKFLQNALNNKFRPYFAQASYQFELTE